MKLRSGAWLLFLVFFVAGCGGLPIDSSFLQALMLSSVFLVACAHARERDTVSDGGGQYETCCENGQVTTCICPADLACNYAWYCVEDDGSCRNGITSSGPGGACDGGVPDSGVPDGGPPIDLGPPDLGGDYEPCCDEGVVSTCFCPADVECNFALYCTWPDGTCSTEFGGTFGAECPVAVDAGFLDAATEAP